ERRANIVGYSEATKSRYSNKYAFSGKIICGNCGSKLSRKRWGIEKYKSYVWLCVNHTDNGNEACSMKAINEEKLKGAFVKAVNKIIEDKDTFISEIKSNIDKVLNKDNSKDELIILESKLQELKEQMLNLVRLNLKSGLDNQIYEEEYQRLEGEVKSLKERKATIYNKDLINDKVLKKADELQDILNCQGDILKEFDDELFKNIIDKLKVISRVEVEFIFKSGGAIREIL
ncbi:MAG: zinc ribbon domain-containing protein, partial [Clostridium sp.]